MIYAHLHLLYMPCLIAGVKYCKCRSPRHTQTFRPVLQPHEISSEVVFRPLSMDERPTVVLGLLALWTGPEKEFQEISAEPGELQLTLTTEAAAHLCFCCSFRVQQGLPTDGTAHGRSPKFGGSRGSRGSRAEVAEAMQKLHGVAPSEELPLAALVGVLLIMQAGDI